MRRGDMGWIARSAAAWGVGAGLLLVACAASSGVAAQEISITPARDVEAPQLPSVSPDAPVLVEADSLTYDSRNETVVATGNATVYYGTYTLRADRIVYDRNNDTVIAYGNITITEEGGSILQAQEIELRDELREGFIYGATAVLSNNARIGAARGTRTGGDVTVFENAVYTACEPCEEDPTKPLTWELKAQKVTHYQAEQMIEYENVTLEMFGTPVAYVPYFSHPDPSVKRKSGFLPPSFSVSDFYGFGVRTPYFWNLAPNYDVTFQPLITTDQGPLFDLEWRHMPSTDGYYTIRPTFIWQADPPEESPGDTTFRGSLETEGEFFINERWSWGWDSVVATDDTYMRRYGLDSSTDLVSEIFLTGISERNYFSARGYDFESLLETDDDSATPTVHPVIDHNYIFDQPVWGGELSLDTEIVSLSRQSGPDSSRLVSDMHWQRRFIGSMGQVAKPFFSVRGDVYATDNVPVPGVPSAIQDEETFGRFMPTAGFEYSWPLARTDGIGTHIFEPIAQVIVRPNEPNRNDVPNEDAQSIAFEANSLFEWDKFSGVDRIEGGSRANVGARYSISDYYGGMTTAEFGQSYHLGGRNSFDERTGLEGDTSDYVASLFYRPNETFRLGWRSRFDDSDFDLMVNELSAAANYSTVRASVNYASVAAEADEIGGERREEIGVRAAYEFADEWEVFGGITYNLEESDPIKDYVGLGYDDDCFGVRLSFEESFFKDRDIEPEQKVMLSFSFKTLGTASISQTLSSGNEDSSLVDPTFPNL